MTASTVSRRTIVKRDRIEGPFAQRLEAVRIDQGYDNLREFWRAVNEGEFRISYEAMRWYHYTDRPPSVEYLAEIVRRWDVDGRWLLTGLS